MKTWMLILAGLWSISCSAVTNSASFLAQCQSLTLGQADGNDSFLGRVATDFTTYDGGSGPPLRVDLGIVSGELRPRASEPGVFETDYFSSFQGGLSEYGFMLFDLPTNDADANGLPDILQRETTVNASFSAGYGKMDFPGTSSFAFSGQLRRNAGTLRGDYDLRIEVGGRTIDYTGGHWSLLRLDGTVEYSRETQNSLRLILTLTAGAGSSARLTGSAIYSVPNADQLVLPQLTLTGSGNSQIIFAPTTLTRSSHRYAGNAVAADGNVASPWPDYTRFVVEAVDDNDSNTNGVPDLTDPTEAPDTTLPRAAFTTPADNAKVTNAVLTVRGTASDNIGIARVEWAVGTNAFQTATGTNNWSAQVPLEFGTNFIFAVAYDYRTNMSNIPVRRVIRLPTSQLMLRVSGQGRVTPNLDGATLIIGNPYTVTAVPAIRHLFAGWSGDLVTNAARLRFIMQTNMMLQANFVTNPFIAVRGQYLGLFTNDVSHESSGAFKVTVTERGRFSSVLRTGGRTYSFAGQFDLEGKATNRIRFQGTNQLTVALCLDLMNGTDQIAGQVMTSNWMARLLAYRPVFGAANPAPYAGRYTMHITGGVDLSSPMGNGVAAILVKSNGTLMLSGMLADGTRAVQTAPVSKDGWWPFYLPLYHGKGSVLSWLMLTNVADGLLGQLNWIKPTVPRDKLYPDGFTNVAFVYGSTYSAQVMTNFLGTNATACLFVSGLLPDIQTNCLTLIAKNTFGGPGVKGLKLDLPTGLWTGTYTNPATGRPLPLKCVLLQQRGYGFGYVLSTNLSAGVVFIPGP
jgi:hypothetical protein